MILSWAIIRAQKKEKMGRNEELQVKNDCMLQEQDAAEHIFEEQDVVDCILQEHNLACQDIDSRCSGGGIHSQIMTFKPDYEIIETRHCIICNNPLEKVEPCAF